MNSRRPIVRERRGCFIATEPPHRSESKNISSPVYWRASWSVRPRAEPRFQNSADAWSALNNHMPVSNPSRQPIKRKSYILMQRRAGLIEAVRVRQQIKGVCFQLGHPTPGILARARGEVSRCSNRVDPLMPKGGKRPRHGHRGGDQENPVEVMREKEPARVSGVLMGGARGGLLW